MSFTPSAREGRKYEASLSPILRSKVSLLEADPSFSLFSERRPTSGRSEGGADVEGAVDMVIREAEWKRRKVYDI